MISKPGNKPNFVIFSVVEQTAKLCSFDKESEIIFYIYNHFIKRVNGIIIGGQALTLPECCWPIFRHSHILRITFTKHCPHTYLAIAWIERAV